MAKIRFTVMRYVIHGEAKVFNGGLVGRKTRKSGFMVLCWMRMTNLREIGFEKEK